MAAVLVKALPPRRTALRGRHDEDHCFYRPRGSAAWAPCVGNGVLLGDAAGGFTVQGLGPQPGAPAQATAFFSATLPEAAEELARSLLAAPVRVTVGARGGAAPSVAQRLLYVGGEAGRRLALRELLAAGLPPPVLVFVASQQRAAVLLKCALWILNSTLGNPARAGLLHVPRPAARKDKKACAGEPAWAEQKTSDQVCAGLESVQHSRAGPEWVEIRVGLSGKP